jgi:replicative DNA helicase
MTRRERIKHRRAVLGAMLANDETARRVYAFMAGSGLRFNGVFGRGPDRTVFEAMVFMAGTGRTVDPPAVAAMLDGWAALDQVGGFSKLADLLCCADDTYPAEFHLGRLIGAVYCPPWAEGGK